MEPLLYAQGSSEVRARVLIVDDEDSVRNSLYRNFESDGYDVLAASNGADALAICHRSVRPIELLVTDYNMPQMTGLQLARECACLNADLSVLYISGARSGRRTSGGSGGSQARFPGQAI